MGTFIGEVREDGYVVREKQHLTGSGEAMASLSGGQGGLGDILSLALRKTGVSSSHSQLPLTHGPPNSVLNQAAGAINDSLLSSDITTLTDDLFSDLAAVKGSPNSLNASPTLTDRVPQVTSTTVNRTGLVHAPPSQNSTAYVSESLSMPVLVKSEATTDPCQQSSVYLQNSTLSQRPTSTLAVTSASVPVSTVSGSFAEVATSIQPTASSFGGQGVALTPTTNSPEDQADPSLYDYSSVLQGDNIDLEGLDEFLAADPDPMDIPPSLPPPPPPHFQTHQQPSAYSSQPVSLNTVNTSQGLLYSPPRRSDVPVQNVHSGTQEISPLSYNHARQQQAYPLQQQQRYGVQQPMMSPAYGGPGNLMSPQHAQLHPPQPTVQTQPFSQQMVSSASYNSGQFTTPSQPSIPMSTNLSDIMPSAPPTNGELVSLSDADIHNILELDNLDFDMNQFDVETNMSTDPFPSFGMSSVDLIQPSNIVRCNGSSLVNSSVGTAVNAPQMRFGVQQQSNGQPGYPNTLHQSGFRPRLNIHSPVFGRSGQIQRSNISRSTRSSAIPMPPQGVVSQAFEVMNTIECRVAHVDMK